MSLKGEGRRLKFCFKLQASSSPALRGMSLIDVIVGTAIMLVVFLAIFGAFKLSIALIYSTKAKTGATALIADRLEYIRGLPYDSIGTVGGIPSGSLAQVATSSLNGVSYTFRTLIAYADDPADGSGDLDENGITADYKTVKVEASWMIRDSSRSTFAVTTVAPVGIETLGSGGTLRVNVLDALAGAVAGASVRIVNPSTTPAIDVTATTNSIGSVSFPGTPVAGGYRITVSKTGYSSAQTYTSTAQNPNPSPGHIAVANHLTSTLTLAIDQTGVLRTLTFSPAGQDEFTDLFSSAMNLAGTTNTEVVGGELRLVSEDDLYTSPGSGQTVSIAPAYLVSWGAFTATTTVPSDTSLAFRFYYFDGTGYVLVPDDAIPGNAEGVTGTSVDLSSLAATTYGTLRVEALLATDDPAATPALDAWSVSYLAGPTPLPSIDFAIRGTKTIGTTAASSPIYKYDSDFSTDEAGTSMLDPMEWDTYFLTPPSAYDVVERCPNTVTLIPGQDLSVAVTLADKTPHSLRVYVSGPAGAVPGATVTVGHEGATTTASVSSCGQIFYGDIASGAYTVTASSPGLQDSTQAVSVSGATELMVPLSP